MANLIFDYDGTIHNSMEIYEPSFRKAYKWLTDNNYAQPRDFSFEDISFWLGFNSTDMWQKFQPGLPPDIKEKVRKLLGGYMNELAEIGRARLFDGAEDMLLDLKNQGHTLIFLSNCRIKYMDMHRKIFGLDRFFDYFYCCEEYDFIPKYQIFRIISLQHTGEYIVIGDRFHDIETASENGLKSIGCAYGYGKDGELKNADIIVTNINQIPAAVKSLTEESQ
ncbi:MAG: HAD family hydrolase [Ruminococcus sp.]|nr:HAD family hydrolase [Ruminococcus sp.]